MTHYSGITAQGVERELAVSMHRLRSTYIFVVGPALRRPCNLSRSLLGAAGTAQRLPTPLLQRMVNPWGANDASSKHSRPPLRPGTVLNQVLPQTMRCFKVQLEAVSIPRIERVRESRVKRGSHDPRRLLRTSQRAFVASVSAFYRR